MQVPAGERAIGNDAHIAGAIAYFPRFTNGRAGGQRFRIERFQFPAAPDSLSYADGWLALMG